MFQVVDEKFDSAARRGIEEVRILEESIWNQSIIFVLTPEIHTQIPRRSEAIRRRNQKDTF